MRYAVVINVPGYMPVEDPFVGTWEECCAEMDESVARFMEDDWNVELNMGCGFRLAGGMRRTYLISDVFGTLRKVVEVIPAHAWEESA